MFFRNQAPKIASFDERISGLQALGFATQSEPGGGNRVQRKGYGAVVKADADGTPNIVHTGLVMGNEIGTLVNLGYQMIFRAPSGKELAAQAGHLKALHAFDEDLREGLGMTSLYNASLGTTTEKHLYDRVADRDSVPHHRPWDR
jgi:hypothetical protein